MKFYLNQILYNYAKYLSLNIVHIKDGTDIISVLNKYLRYALTMNGKVQD